MTKILFSGLVVLALHQAAAVALAQVQVDGPKVQELKKTDSVPPATGKNLPEQAGAQEPGSKVQGTAKNADVFVNGVLAVPGAVAETETSPAKYSDRIAAGDRLSIAAFRLRRLTDAQLNEVTQQLSIPRRIVPAGGEEFANLDSIAVGALVPAPVLASAAPVPEAIAASLAELRGAGFIRAGSKLILVDLDNSLVIGVLDSGK